MRRSLSSLATSTSSYAPPADKMSDALDLHASQSWRPLHFLNLYRLTLAGLFLTIITLETTSSLLGKHNPAMFFIVSLLYVGASVMNSYTIRLRRPAFIFQVSFQGIIDIIAVTLLMHTSGSLSSGLGILLIVAIAGASLLIARRSAILLAAIATLMLLLEQTYIVIYNENLDTSFTQAGMLGAILFATAAVGQFLSRRIRESEALAAQRGVDLANMEQLTEYVIQRMQTGIVVVDHETRIRLINESAWHLLGMPPSPSNQRLTTISPELAIQLRDWQKNPNSTLNIFRPTRTSAEVIPRFARLGTEQSAGTLIFLEDIASMAQQAQQLKLASLGRLTASIAHEIRNPLGAISHAGQLLAESQNLDTGESRMTQIIKDNSKRVNTIIENVLQLSRRQQSKPEDLKLSDWLEHFVDEFCQTQQIDPATLELAIPMDGLTVRFDPSQLHQIIWNLCQNGLRYTQANAEGIVLRLQSGVADDPPTPTLDVIDFGPGIDAATSEQIFEPFFTTDAKGTGLGLYIARELCEANQARLSYQPNPEGGSCFRITFMDIRRTQMH